MKAFNDLKVGSKLIAGFASVATIAAVIGFVGVSKIDQVARQDVTLYQIFTVPLADLGSISVAFQRARINLRDAVETKNPAERQAYEENIRSLRHGIEEGCAGFEKTIVTRDVREQFDSFKEARGEYVRLADQVLKLSAGTPPPRPMPAPRWSRNRSSASARSPTA